jgi:hypothetical protein
MASGFEPGSNFVFQVKYTNQYPVPFGVSGWECMTFDRKVASQQGCAGPRGRVLQKGLPDGMERSIAALLLFLDQIKREKGVWWMPWQ